MSETKIPMMSITQKPSPVPHHREIRAEELSTETNSCRPTEWIGLLCLQEDVARAANAKNRNKAGLAPIFPDDLSLLRKKVGFQNAGVTEKGKLGVKDLRSIPKTAKGKTRTVEASECPKVN